MNNYRVSRLRIARHPNNSHPKISQIISVLFFATISGQASKNRNSTIRLQAR